LTPKALLLLLYTEARNSSDDSLEESPPSIEIARAAFEGEVL
jgi:hypothetical protein